MKTATQELIDWNNSRDKFNQISWIELDNKLKSLLEKEKEQIMEAYRKGYTQAFLETTEPEYYYNETYLE